MSVIEVVNVSREVSWLPWAVQYFFLIGLSVALFLMSLPGALKGGNAQERFARLALLGALVCGLVAPVALLADLHQPGRFWRFYTQPNLKSWMAWGAFFIPGYLGGLMVYAYAAFRPELAASRSGPFAPLHQRLALPKLPMPWLPKVAAGVTVLFGALVLLYTGMEVMVVRARPLWNTPLLPLQFVATAFTGAAGLVLVLNALLDGRDAATHETAARWLKASLLATIVLGLIWFALGFFGLSSTHAQALASVSGVPYWQTTALWAGAATMAPLLLMVLRPGAFGLMLGVIALHAAWMFRWSVFIGGQSVPKTGAGLYAYSLPLGREGLLGIAGTFGLWLAVFILLLALLPRTKADARSLSPAEQGGHHG